MSLASTLPQFFHFCRTGKLNPSIEDANLKGLQVYHELTHRNFEMTLKCAYPITYQLLSLEQWNILIDSFLTEENCSSPLLWKMPQYFLNFVQKSSWKERWNLPYLHDLLNFEWLEIELFMMPDIPFRKEKEKKDPLDSFLRLNPESRLVVYSYPVFKKKLFLRNLKKGLYPLLVYRHPETKEVNFISLSPFFATFLECIEKWNLIGRDALEVVATKFGLDPEQAISEGEKFLKDLLEQGALAKST